MLTLAILAQAAMMQMPAVLVNSYPAPMIDVDGSNKYVAVVTPNGVELRHCQHMAWTSTNNIACDFKDGEQSYNVVIPVVKEAVDVRQPYEYLPVARTK